MGVKPSDLAIHGGPKTRAQPLPPRRLFGVAELESVRAVFEEAWANGADFGYQGSFEQAYVEAFCRLQGGGRADAVASGTAAVWLALAALDLEPESDVVVSPVTDPGGVAPVLLQGHGLAVADAAPGSFNVGPEELERALTPRTRAAILTHAGGRPFDLEPVMEVAARRGVAVIEDCSQAHGALYKGRRVGTFGAAAVFSTMFSKAHATGGSGGLAYTRDESLYWRVRALADRGKPFRDAAFDPRDPRAFLFPALNLNLDEVSCAIGLSTLSRLEDTIERRLAVARWIDEGLAARSRAVSPVPALPGTAPSPFFHTVRVDERRLMVSKVDFAKAVQAEGIWINPDYRYVVAEWPWAAGRVRGKASTPNAAAFRDATFNVLFNERFTREDAEDVVRSILKVEEAYRAD